MINYCLKISFLLLIFVFSNLFGITPAVTGGSPTIRPDQPFYVKPTPFDRNTAKLRDPQTKAGDFTKAYKSESNIEYISKSLHKVSVKVKDYALKVFFVLVLIDIVWSFGMMALKGAEFGEFMVAIMKRTMWIGIFLFLFTLSDWLYPIFHSFVKLSEHITGYSVSPDSGFTLANTLFKHFVNNKTLSAWYPITSMAMFFLGVAAALIVVFMTIDLIVVNLKFYFAAIIVYFTLALGGLSRFQDMGVNPILSIIKLGIEIFLITIMLMIAFSTVDLFLVNEFEKEDLTVPFNVLCMLIMIYMGTKAIGSTIEAIFNGQIGDTAGASSGIKAVMTAAAGLGVAAATGGKIGSVGQLGTALSGGIGKGASKTAAAAGGAGVGLARSASAAHNLAGMQGAKGFEQFKKAGGHMAQGAKETMSKNFSDLKSSIKGHFTDANKAREGRGFGSQVASSIHDKADKLGKLKSMKFSDTTSKSNIQMNNKSFK